MFNAEFKNNTVRERLQLRRTLKKENLISLIYWYNVISKSTNWKKHSMFEPSEGFFDYKWFEIRRYTSKFPPSTFRTKTQRDEGKQSSPPPSPRAPFVALRSHSLLNCILLNCVQNHYVFQDSSSVATGISLVMSKGNFLRTRRESIWYKMYYIEDGVFKSTWNNYIFVMKNNID
jgi:hypothetical protein